MIEPGETDRRLEEWLERTAGVKLAERTEPNATRRKFVALATRCEPDLKKAIAKVRELLKPASEAVLTDALLSLEQSTAKPNDSDDANDFKLDRYVTKLRDYPADIALHELATWDDHAPPLGLYFPKWAALKVHLDARFEWRRQVLPALQAFTPADAEEIDTRTPEEKEADRQRVGEKYLATCKRLGVRPKRDLLPAVYDAAEVEAMRPVAKKAATGLIMDRVRKLEEADREIAMQELHGDG